VVDYELAKPAWIGGKDSHFSISYIEKKEDLKVVHFFDVLSERVGRAKELREIAGELLKKDCTKDCIHHRMMIKLLAICDKDEGK